MMEQLFRSAAGRIVAILTRQLGPEHLDLAEDAVQDAVLRALETWPHDDHALNNLGNLLATQGRFDDALALYQRAAEASPTNAAPHYNASQVHTRRFDYHAASEALARANALDFDLVKSYQDLTVQDGTLSLVDQWLSPRRFWEAMLRGPLPSFSTAALPPTWRCGRRRWPLRAPPATTISGRRSWRA